MGPAEDGLELELLVDSLWQVTAPCDGAVTSGGGIDRLLVLAILVCLLVCRFMLCISFELCGCGLPGVSPGRRMVAGIRNAAFMVRVVFFMFFGFLMGV